MQGKGYAVHLGRLLRVEDSGEAFRVPLTPDGVVGALVVDGDLVPMLDSSWLTGVADGRNTVVPYKVLIATEFGPVALPADTTIGIVAAGRGEWVTSEQEFEYLQSKVFRYRGGEYSVLDVDMFIMSLSRS